MKTLLGVLLVASFLCATAAAQGKKDQPQPDQPAAPEKRNYLQLMMLSQPQKPATTNDDKIEAELANQQRTFELKFTIGFVVIDGAVYTSVGDELIPLPGGGASGCFDPTGVATAARIERARAEWAKRPK
ncbi:hypothetical protein L0337_08375 [candidate division KSB1 bacterium]|nr:hypothetical protein [candidate division KSB1 bacterium]